MRVWLVEDSSRKPAADLKALLRDLELRPEADLRLVGVASSHGEFVAATRAPGSEVPDLVVYAQENLIVDPTFADVFALGIGVIVATESSQVGRYIHVVGHYSIAFVVPSNDPGAFWLTLLNAYHSQSRERKWKDQVDRLEQRLRDRIVIERAKGVLIQCLRISEDEAYQRLRVLARQQQRRMRDVAQTLLNTRSLLEPAGHSPDPPGEEAPERDEPPFPPALIKGRPMAHAFRGSDQASMTDASGCSHS